MASVLIVEDSYNDRKNLIRFFKDYGFEIAGEAINGMHAALMYEDLSPDLVTMDLLMDSKDGFLGIEKIRALDNGAQIVVVTSVRDKAKVVKALDLGAAAYIIKPFDKTKLTHTLHQLGFKK